MRAMTDPPKRPRPPRPSMNARSAEGAFVTAVARRRSNQLKSRTFASGSPLTLAKGPELEGQADLQWAHSTSYFYPERTYSAAS